MSDATIVEVFNEYDRWIEVETEEVHVIEIVSGQAGPQGPQGPPGPAVVAAQQQFIIFGVVHNQTTPSANWVIPHSFARRPQVCIYIGDEEIETDLHADLSFVTITFPTPQVGQAILT